jgi:AraC-like DNA-binding protein
MTAPIVFDTLMFGLAIGLGMFGVVQLLYRPRLPIHCHSAIVFFCLCGALFHAWAMKTGVLSANIVLSHADACALFCAAPAVYLCSDSIIEEARALSFRQGRHYILPAAVIALFAFLNVVATPVAETLSRCAAVAAAATLCGYTLAALLRAAILRVREPGWRVPEIRALAIFPVGLLAAAATLLVAEIMRSDRLGDVAVFAFCFFIAAYALTRVRWPAHEAALLRPGRRQSLLEGVDTAALARELKRLMEERRMYRRPDISLAAVARALGISAPQASELINEQMHANFRGYINAYRVRAIERELVERPQVSILEIAFDNGFNSKSTFNTIFTRITGESPREYRRKRLKQP